jgi:hypothetical protein
MKIFEKYKRRFEREKINEKMKEMKKCLNFLDLFWQR